MSDFLEYFFRKSGWGDMSCAIRGINIGLYNVETDGYERRLPRHCSQGA